MCDVPKTIHIVSYTHWDREFRFDFETTRVWLVRLMDDLIEIMTTKPGYAKFMLDGQFTLIDDYLEVRPEMKPRVETLARQGRLQLGPWYSLPDSSSIHGESLVRNLMTGLDRARQLDAAMMVGYNVFSFGQISQLPQVYANFGIDFILFYKHMNKKRSGLDEFVWEAPDGTKALTTSLGREARWNFFFAGHIPILYNRDPWHKDWQFHWNDDLGKTFHLCEAENYAGFHFVTRPTETLHKDQVKFGFDRTIEALPNTAVPEHLLFFDGTDFTAPHPLIPEVIEEANKIYQGQYVVKHSTLADYAQAVRPLLEQRDLRVVTGEMKDGPLGSIHTDVCSSHPALKRANGQAENALFRQGEPLAALAYVLGAKYPQPLIDKALKYLFLSQAHDSLHGVGPKTMCDDIASRLLQARVIGQNIATVAMQDIAAEIDTASQPDAEMFLTVFNSFPQERSDVLEALLDIPRDILVEDVILEDENGQTLDGIVLDIEDSRAGIYHPRSRNMPYYSKRYHVLFEAKDLPAMGYRTYKVKWTSKPLYPYPHEDFNSISVPYAPLACDGRCAENEHLAIRFHADGSFDLTHKASGQVYPNLNYYTDIGEMGTVYTHEPLRIDRAVSTQGAAAEVNLLINTPLLARWEIRHTLSLPVDYDNRTRRRSEVRKDVPVTTVVTLKKNSPVVDVRVTIDNRVKDHFFRVHFPTGIATERTYAGGVFDVNAYPTQVSRDGLWQGKELTRHQQHLFIDISDGQAGLAVLNDTLRDYEIVDAANGTIAQSILRASNLRIPVDNRLWMEYPGDDSAQSLGEFTTQYALYPHDGEWCDAPVASLAQQYATPIRLVQLGRQTGTQPAVKSFVNLSNRQLIVSCLKKAQDRSALVLRVFNPTEKDQTTDVELGFDIQGARTLWMSEEPREAVDVRNQRSLSLTVPHKKIVTLELTLA